MSFISPRRFIILFLGMLIGFADSAEGATPAWLKLQPKEDVQYRYYIGRSNPAPSQAEAFKQSYQDAVENAIKENFGYSLEINKSSYQGIDKENLSEKVQERFRQVEVHGFELQEQYFSETKDASTEAFTLFRYSKQEIKKERERLESMKESAPVRSFSELRGHGAGVGSTLSVITKPSNASIFLDGESYGKSDAKIRNLSVGQHVLKIEHENYEPVEETVNLTPGAEIRVEEHLQLSKGQIKVESSLPNALITVNGKVIGTTPTDLITVNAGEEIVIRAVHPEAEVMLQKLEVSRNEKREVLLHLQPKPSFILLTSKPPLSTVLVNGEELGKTDAFGRGKFPVPAGSLEIVVRKEKYEDETKEEAIHGGETKQLGDVKLTSLAEIQAQNSLDEKFAKERAEKRQQEESAKERQERDQAAEAAAHKPWRILLGLGGSGISVSNLNVSKNYFCCILLDIGLERHFGNIFAFRLFYTYRGGSEGSQIDAPTTGAPNTSREVLTSSNSNEIGAGAYFSPISNIVIGPEVGSTSTRLGFRTNRFDKNGFSTSNANRSDQLTQQFYGLNLGFESTIAEKAGGYVDLGLRKYQNAGVYKGGNVFQIKGGVMLGF